MLIKPCRLSITSGYHTESICSCSEDQILSTPNLMLLLQIMIHYHTNIIHPFRSTRFIFRAVCICVLVLCPLTGKLIACLLPRYVPISLNRLMLSCSCRLRSVSIFMLDNSALILKIWLLTRLLTFAVGWMWNRAIIRCDTLGPIP